MADEPTAETPKQRVPTGVPGLDTLLKGGLLPGRIYMVTGRPGAGKTILANQIAFHHVAAGGRVLYVTLLTESHTRLLSAIEGLAFFDARCLSGALVYVSGYQALESDERPLERLLALLSQAVSQHQATMLIVDGLVTAGSVAKSDVELKRFIYGLQILVELIGCTTLVLTGATDQDSNYAERTMVDGLVELSTKRVGMRTIREVEVLKVRGGDILTGAHFFDITNAGITIHPRAEARLGRQVVPEAPRGQTVSLGSRPLDDLFAGELTAGSATMVLGATGTGKTLLGLQFLLSGAEREEPGVFFGFYEDPRAIVDKARRTGLWPRRPADQNRLEIMCQPPSEQLADALASRLLATIEERQARRVFIDGWAGFEDALIYPERNHAFFVALREELRARGVTMFVSKDAPEWTGSLVGGAASLGAVVDNVVLLRRVELNGGARRFVSIVKMRQGAHDASLRALSLGEGGLVVGGTFGSAQANLRGRAPAGRKKRK